MGVLRSIAQYAGFAAPEVVHVLTGDVAQAQVLGPVVASDFGINLYSDKVTREDALGIPAVSRGRDAICNTIGSFPLVAVRSTVVLERPFLKQLGALPLTNAALLAATVEDLLFYRISWWRIVARDGQGFPATVERIGGDRVLWDTNSGRVKIDGKLVADKDLIRFDGASPGLLTGKKARSLRTAILLEDAVRNYARLDVPLGFIADSEGGMTPAEVTEMLNEWEVARKTRTTSYLPKGITYQSAVLDAQKIELGAARAYQAADVARMLNLPASIVNAPSNDSLTYATTESNRRELVDITLRPFTTVIEQRLSMPDVTPRGMDVQFSLTRFLLGDTATVLSAGETAIRSGIMTIDEVRTQWLGLSPLPQEDAQ